MGGYFYALPLSHSCIYNMKFLSDDRFLGGIHNYER
jgi:hypothetical protein